MKFGDRLRSFGVRADNSVALALATDGLKSDANILMMAMITCDDDAREISVFIKGGDINTGKQYHQIPAQVYESQGVDKETVTEVLAAKLDELGILHIVCIQAHRFVKPRVLESKLIPRYCSFIDIGLMDKASMFWTDSLSESTTIHTVQEKVGRMRGKNMIKLEALADQYEVKPIDNSPYIPMNKAAIVREIFRKQLELEMPY